MKKVKLSVLTLGLLSLFFSCSKEKEGLDLSKLESKKTAISFEGSAQAEVQLPIVELDPDLAKNNKEAFRSIIINNGYGTAPTISFEQETDPIKANWGVRTASGADNIIGGSIGYADIENFFTDEAAKQALERDASLADRGYGIFRVNGKISLMQKQTAKSLDQVSEPLYSWMSLNGFMTDEGQLNFTAKGAGEVNRSIQGIKQGEKNFNRNIPFTTRMFPLKKKARQSDKGHQQYDKKLGHNAYTLGQVQFEARGSLVGLRFVNNIGRDIELISLNIVKNNAIFSEGYFAPNTGIASEGAEIPFVGKDDVSSYEYTFTDNRGLAFYKSYAVPYHQDVTAEQKASLPLFYIWGYQKGDRKGQPIKLQVRYKLANGKGGQRETWSSLIQLSPANSEGFEEGKVYHTTVQLERTPAVPKVLPKTMSLEEFASFNLIDQRMGNSNEYPDLHDTDYYHIATSHYHTKGTNTGWLKGNENTGYYGFERIAQHLNGNEIYSYDVRQKYHIVTAEEYARLFPVAKSLSRDNDTDSRGRWPDPNKKTTTEFQEDTWLRFDKAMPRTKYYSWEKGATDKIDTERPALTIAETKEEDGKFVTYAFHIVYTSGDDDFLDAAENVITGGGNYTIPTNQSLNSQPFKLRVASASVIRYSFTTDATSGEKGLKIQQRLVRVDLLDDTPAGYTFDEVFNKNFFNNGVTRGDDRVAECFFPAWGNYRYKTGWSWWYIQDAEAGYYGLFRSNYAKSAPIKDDFYLLYFNKKGAVLAPYNYFAHRDLVGVTGGYDYVAFRLVKNK